jgi:4-amino-4-deoxy-L-arabinose transferase-like glycosyltransferase
MNKRMSKKSEFTMVFPANRVINLPLSLTGVALVSVLTIFVALRIWHIATYSLGGGEAFAMMGAKKDWSAMFSYIVSDIVHPPLFYVVLKLWILIGGESLLWLKLLAVLSGVAMLIPLLLLCRELNLRLPVITLAVLLMAINGYMIHYAQELRMYGMFAFLALCSFWLFIRYFRSPGNNIRALFILTTVNLLTIYTHYFGWVVVGVEFLFLLIWRRKIVAFGVSIIFLLVIFSPWAYLVIQEARSIGGLDRNLDWVPKPRPIDILDFYSTLNGPIGSRYIQLFGFFLFGLPLMLWFIKIVRTWRQESIREDVLTFSWLALLAFLPVIVIFLVSQKLDQALWIDRYFIFIAPPYLLLIAVAVYRLEPKWVRNIYIVLIILWSVIAGINDLKTNRMAWAGAQLGSRIKWESLALQMGQAEPALEYPVKVYTLPVVSRGIASGYWTIATSLNYYLDLHNDSRFEIVSVRNNNALIAKVQEDHFWVAYFYIVDSPQPGPEALLEENGYRIGDKLAFSQRGNRIVLLPVWKK